MIPSICTKLCISKLFHGRPSELLWLSIPICFTAMSKKNLRPQLRGIPSFSIPLTHQGTRSLINGEVLHVDDIDRLLTLNKTYQCFTSPVVGHSSQLTTDCMARGSSAGSTVQSLRSGRTVNAKYAGCG